MKAFIIPGRYQSYFEDRQIPPCLKDTDVLVKVKAVGICGTDLHIYEGEHKASQGQLRLPGHEFSGEVVSVGSAVSDLRTGDRVVHEPISYCGTCYACRKGQGNVCENLRVTGCTCDGGLTEYVVAHAQQWHKIPAWMSWEQAAFVEPYTIATHCNSRAEVSAGDVVLVQGGGPIGLMCADVANKLGAVVILTEVQAGRIELAKAIGVKHVINPLEGNMREKVLALTSGMGPNVVFDCVGLANNIRELISMLSPAGRFVPVAPAPFSCEGRDILIKQLRIIGCRLQMGQFRPVIENFSTFKDNVDRMITHVFRFEETVEAFAFAAQRHPETGKIVIRFD